MEEERKYLIAYRSWCKIIKKIKANLDSKKITDDNITSYQVELEHSVCELKKSSDRIMMTLEDEDDMLVQEDNLQKYLKETKELIDLLKKEEDSSKKDTIEKTPSRSRSSSCVTSTSSRVEKAAKVARLKAELNYSEAEAKAEAMLNKIRLSKRLAGAQAELDAVDRTSDVPHGPNLLDCSSDILQNYVDNQAASLNPQASEFQPKPLTQTPKPNLNPTSMIPGIWYDNHLPRPEPPVFKGDCLQFPLWRKNFAAYIESRTLVPSDRLFYIGKYTSGDAHEAVKGLIYLDTEEAFQKAIQILQDRYGNPFVVANAYRQKIQEWPKIPVNDGISLRKFSDFLQACLVAMESIKYLSPLNDPEENQKILRKLPNYLITRWSRIVDSQLNEGLGGYPNFSVFCDFIQKEARIACNPVTSFKSDAIDKKLKPPIFNRKTFGTEAHVMQGSHNVPQESRRYCCFKCKKDHELNDCPEFLKLSYADRFAYCQKQSLCRGCLKWGHMKIDCKRKKVCNMCGKFHPSSLHDDKFAMPFDQKAKSSKENSKMETLKDVKAMMTETSKDNVNGVAADACYSHSQMVPVTVSSNNNNQVEVICVIDEQSDTCFIDEQLMNDLNVSGPDVNLELSTMHGTHIITSQRVTGLTVTGMFEDINITVPVAYTRPSIPISPSQVPRKETALSYRHLIPIADYLLSREQDMRIGMLLGINCMKAVKPIEVLPGKDNEPFGIRTALGWGIVGMIGENNCEEISKTICITSALEEKPCHFAFKTRVKEILTVKEVNNLFDIDFIEDHQEKFVSHEDNMFMDIMRKGIHQLDNGQWEMPLPLRKPNVMLPDNKPAVLKRMNGLKQKLEKDEKYRKHYFKFMDGIFQNGYCEQVPENELNLDNGKIWYLPHFGRYHPKKPEKLRIVFDASIVYNGFCLNKVLLQGPDLTNNLLGVLCRFREERIAFTCDIESMFFRFKVNVEDRNYFRFLWWPDNDMKKEPAVYRMTVHLFGASSSPSCANFGLKATADLYEEQYGKKAADFIRNDFYVDDGLKSVPTIEEAKEIINNTRNMCERSGLRLHKFLSNKKEALEEILPEDKDEMKDFEIEGSIEKIGVQRALGVQWCIESDTFQFRVELKDCPLTRRGILSTIGSVFDPLGLVSPCILLGKQILKELCKDGISWDDEIPDEIRSRWIKWRADLPLLVSLQIPRSYCPENFGNIKSIEVHHFSDASLTGYGQSSYIKLKNEANEIHCSLAIAKSRVSPSKQMTVPRLELASAVLSTRVSAILRREITYENYKENFWTDSRVVLGYIANDVKRFHIYVANRVQQIRSHVSPDNWYFIDGHENPADVASRGMSAELLVKCEKWWKGPDCLYHEVISQPQDIEECKLLDLEDPEVKKLVSLAINTNLPTSMSERFASFSDWYKLKSAVSCCIRIQKLYKKNSTYKLFENGVYIKSSLSDLKDAEILILKEVQMKCFAEELKVVKNLRNIKESKEKKRVLKTSNILYRLDPFVDGKGLLRVGGRIKNADLPDHVKHPVILPRKSHVTELIVKHMHGKIHHQGRTSTYNLLRASGYWLIGGRAVVSNIIIKCVTCKRLYGKTEVQKMSPLPKDRLEATPPFHYSAVDNFGPFYVKEGRKEMKRYGVIFVCMYSRAIHLEVSHDMTTDSFLMAYRRFVCRRGPVAQLRSDQGSNFVGAVTEMQLSLKEMNQDRIKDELKKDGCDYINFKMNPPESSHMGGSWERLILSVRKVLVALLSNHGSILNDETLHTFMTEAECIVNCRPLCASDMSDPDYPNPITPNQLLTLKPQVLLPPPGVFLQQDVYAKKRWRRVQFLANQFWRQWSSDYMHSLQHRRKWNKEFRNFEIDDVVLIKDDNLPRNEWRLGRVCEVFKSNDGLVRKVRLVLGDRTSGNSKKYLERPIHKLIMLVRKEKN